MTACLARRAWPTLAFLVSAAVPPAQTVEPKPAVPVDAITTIVDAFRTHAVVAIPDAHGNQQLHDFLLALIRDPRLPGTVHDVIIEGANARYQELVDQFVRGDDVAPEALRPVWQESTQVQFVLDEPLYTEVLPAIRAVNASVPADRRIRVLLGDTPMDWADVTGLTDHRKWVEQRETFPADLIPREVLAKRRRALLVFGQMHFQRKNAAANFRSDGLAASIVSLLEDQGDTRVFTIWWVRDLEKMQPDVTSWPVPSLTIVRGTTIGATNVAYDGPRFPIRDGRPDFSNPIPRSEWRSLRIEDQYDAALWLGPLTSMTDLKPSRALCADEAYVRKRLDRLALVQAGPAIVDRVKRACARDRAPVL